MLRRLRKGQSTAEYAILVGLVIAAALTMQTYVKRGIQAKIKNAVDYKDNASILTDTQYEPYYVESNMTSGRTAGVNVETTAPGQVAKTEDTVNSTRTGDATTLGDAVDVAPVAKP